MNSIGIFAKSIIAITFMWAFLQSIMPGQKFKKCCDFIYGLIIISMVVSMVSKVPEFDPSYFADSKYEISNYSNSYVLNLYEQKLQEAMQKKFNDKSIKVELDENYKVKKITCDDINTQKEIEEYLNE